MGFIAYEQVQGQTAGNLEVVSAERSEVRQLFHMCEGAVDSTIAGVQTGTTQVFEYFNTDKAHAKRVLVDVVIPVVTSGELACETAQTDVAHVRHANGDALAKALDANAPADELKTKLDAFHAAPR